MPSDLSMTDIFSWALVALPYILAILLVVYLILGGVLDYHWRRYGGGILDSLKLRAAYIAVGIVLFGSLFVVYLQL